MRLSLLAISLTATLISCGQSTPHRHHEKQATSADIKISTLNLQKQQLQMRFEYRSYIKKEFKSIDCRIKFTEKEAFSLTLMPAITFDSFATEVLIFNDLAENLLEDLNELKEIPYFLGCKVTYDKGTEYIEKKSVLYIAPNSQFIYR